MPQRELKHPSQIEAWLTEWGEQLAEAGSLILIGSGGLLWHAAPCSRLAGKKTCLEKCCMTVAIDTDFLVAVEIRDHLFHKPADALRERKTP